jgi:hypothetical protein
MTRPRAKSWRSAGPDPADFALGNKAGADGLRHMLAAREIDRHAPFVARFPAHNADDRRGARYQTRCG